MPRWARVASASLRTLASCLSLGLRTPMPRVGMGLLRAWRPATRPAWVPALPVAWTRRSTVRPISLSWATSSAATWT